MDPDQKITMTGSIEKNDRAADVIIQQLEQQILSGKLPDQSPLPAERDLMQQYSASRTVVREAITALSNRGLVENRPRFRPIVRKPGFDSAMDAVGGIVRHLVGQHAGVKNLYYSRVFVERLLVRDAATSARKSDIENLASALSDNQDSIPNSNDFYLTDTAFHAVLYQIPGNPIFPALHEAYTSWLEPHWIKMQRSAERNRFNYRSHAAIYNAIVDRDPDLAEAELLSHLNAAWEHVRITFSQEEL